MEIKNTLQLQEAFAVKALGANLTVDCPCDGLFNSEIAIIAEAPGEREVQARSPLVGGSGTMLWNSLRKVGITRNDCFITNVAKRQVAFDIDERRAPLSKHEFDHWSELLRWELSHLPNLRFVVALGNFALEALSGHVGITNWRGSVIPVTLYSYNGERPRTVTLIASFNPAAVLRNPKDELVFHMDMGRVKRVIEGKWRDHPINTIINPSMDDAISYLRLLRNTGGPVAHDIETLGGETACIGLSNNPHEAICINFRDARSHRFSVKEEAHLRREIQEFYNDKSIQLVGQNNMFDASWLWYKDKIKTKPAWHDTMLAHHTLYPLLPHGLGFIVTQYTTHPFYKDEREAWKEGGDIDGHWRYNCKDAALTLAAALKMDKELEQQGLSEFFYSHVMRLQPHLVRMVVGGVLVDSSLRRSINESLREELEDLKADFYKKVHDATGDTEYYPNPLSPAQLSDLLFNKLRLVGRGASTNEENRERMRQHPKTSDKAREVIDALTRYKEEHKFFSTYVDTEIDEDGRMRCEYKQTGVQKAPGRLSSAKVLWGHYDIKTKKVIQHGMNLQNQPKRAHEMFIADPGYTFVYADGSQAEARYVGWDAEITSWIEQFEQARLDGKYDAHRALASQIFNVPYHDVPTDDEKIGEDGRLFKTIRYKSKRARHGLNYRMMPDRFATTAGIPINEAQRIFDVYHRLHPELRKWWKKQEDDVRSTRFLYNSFGRRLFIQGRMDDPDTLESIVAFRPQSTIGDHVSKVIYLCESDPRWPRDARLALNVHDAVIALAPIDKARLCASLIKKYMEQPIIVRPTLPELIIPADVAIAEPDEQGVRRWSTLKKLKDIEAAR